ncbi:MAG: sensor histidine kinase [Spirochaetaceae bacterium]
MATFLKAAKRFLSRTYVRLTVLFSSLFLVGAVAFFGISLFSLYNSLQQDDVRELQSRLLQYWARYQSGGIEALRNEIDARNILIGERPFFVRIASAANETQFFSVPALWQQGFPLHTLEDGEISDWDGVKVLRSDVLPYRLELAGIRLSNRYFLQVGLSTEGRDQLLELFQRNFMIIASAVVLMSLALGLLLAYRVLRPVRDLSTTVHNILETGTFDTRIRQDDGLFSPQGDLRELVVYFNEMLTRIERLIGGMHDALDAVAHDLRTPLTRLRGSAELALKGEGSEAAYREALSDTIEEADTIMRLLNTLMDISEAQSGALSLNLEYVDASGVLRDSADVYEYVADARNVTIEIGDCQGISLYADPVRLRQVLANLIDNAVKYSNPGGRVTVTCVSVPAGVMFRVVDQGQGISAEDMPRIWNRLYRGVESRNKPGLGLGLSLVKAIVEAHRGEVQLHSEPGQGTEVRILLPAEPVSEV